MNLIERKYNYKVYFLILIFLSASPIIFTFKIKTSILLFIFFYIQHIKKS